MPTVPGADYMASLAIGLLVPGQITPARGRLGGNHSLLAVIAFQRVAPRPAGAPSLPPAGAGGDGVPTMGWVQLCSHFHHWQFSLTGQSTPIGCRHPYDRDWHRGFFSDMPAALGNVQSGLSCCVQVPG